MHIPPVAHDQAELFSRKQALEAATSAGAFDRARAHDGMVRLARGIHTAQDLSRLDRREGHLLEARAQLLALGDAWVAARRTAAVLHGLPLLGPAPAQVQLTRGRTTRRTRSDNRHRHINALPDDEREVVDGIATTTLARTVFDLARKESRRSAVVVMDAALASGLPREAIEQVLRTHRGWPGVRAARWALDFADARAESVLESLSRAICVDENLPAFEPQVLVVAHGEVIARVDGLWREQLVVFEADGGLKFDRPGALPELLVRQERIREAGLPVVRAGWKDMTHRREQWADGVRRDLAERPGRLAPGVELVRVAPKLRPLERTDHYSWPPAPRLSGQHSTKAAPAGSVTAAKRRVA